MINPIGLSSASMKMAVFAGNIGYRIPSQPQCFFFSIPWAIWKCQIGCMKSRDISSGPVKYIPKTSYKEKISETSPSTRSSENSSYSSHHTISASKINGGKGVYRRPVLYKRSQLLDKTYNGFLFDDSQQECEQLEVAEEGVEELRIHQAGDCCEQDILQKDKCIIDAEESAVKLLAMRALTAVELKNKLYGKRFSPDIVEVVINKFQSRGLINDSMYAEAFSRSRWSSSSWGPRRIKKALFKKGISQADAEKAVELVFKENYSDEDDKLSISLSKHSMDQLYVQASKQWLRYQDVPKETRKSRIVRWLQYRGFDWDVINFILRKLDGKDPP